MVVVVKVEATVVSIEMMVYDSDVWWCVVEISLNRWLYDPKFGGDIMVHYIPTKFYYHSAWGDDDGGGGVDDGYNIIL